MTEVRIAADDGVELWLLESGDPTAAVTVLCCHGGPGIADYLGPVEHALASDFRVIRWDQRGSGRSDRTGPFTIARFVADTDCIRRAVGPERFVILGHSWGANLAILYAQYHPDRLLAIVYLSGIGLEWWPTYSAIHKARQLERLDPEAGQRLRLLRTRDRTEAEEVEYRLLYIRSELHDVADVPMARAILAEERRHRPNPEVNAALNTESRELPLMQQVERLHSIDCPMLVIHGGSDPRPIEALASMIEAVPEVEVDVFHDAGHRPWIEQPPRFHRAVSNFIRNATGG